MQPMTIKPFDPDKTWDEVFLISAEDPEGHPEYSITTDPHGLNMMFVFSSGDRAVEFMNCNPLLVESGTPDEYKLFVGAVSRVDFDRLVEHANLDYVLVDPDTDLSPDEHVKYWVRQ